MKLLHLALLALSCSGGSRVLGGLLPEGAAGNSGYRYDRPRGAAAASTSTTPGLLLRDGAGANGFPRFPGTYRNQLTFGNFDGFVNNNNNNNNNIAVGGFGNRPYDTYGTPQNFQNPYRDSNNGFQGTGFGYNPNGDNGRPQPYSFQYEVLDPPSGNDYSQRESSDGNVVRGEYRVLLPDTRTQIVKYTADDATGYNAEVQYEGQAQFPRANAFQGGSPNYPGTSFPGPTSNGRGGFGFSGYPQFGAGGGFSPSSGFTGSDYNGGTVFGDVSSNRYLPPASAPVSAGASVQRNNLATAYRK